MNRKSIFHMGGTYCTLNSARYNLFVHTQCYLMFASQCEYTICQGKKKTIVTARQAHQFVFDSLSQVFVCLSYRSVSSTFCNAQLTRLLRHC